MKWIEVELQERLLNSENLDKLGRICGIGNLSLYGVEYRIGVGSRVDIIAHTSSQECVIIELQKGRGDDRHLQNIIRYAQQSQSPIMIWVAETFSIDESCKKWNFCCPNQQLVFVRASKSSLCGDVVFSLYYLTTATDSRNMGYKIENSPSDRSCTLGNGQSISSTKSQLRRLRLMSLL